jgi:hypothetical protein
MVLRMAKCEPGGKNGVAPASSRQGFRGLSARSWQAGRPLYNRRAHFFERRHLALLVGQFRPELGVFGVLRGSGHAELAVRLRRGVGKEFIPGLLAPRWRGTSGGFSGRRRLFAGCRTVSSTWKNLSAGWKKVFACCRTVFSTWKNLSDG